MRIFGPTLIRIIRKIPRRSREFRDMRQIEGILPVVLGLGTRIYCKFVAFL